MNKNTAVAHYMPVIRLIVMGISFLATFMVTTFGWNPLPFSDDQITEGLTWVISIGLAIYNWFKDQPVTSYGKAKAEAGVKAVGHRKDFTNGE